MKVDHYEQPSGAGRTNGATRPCRSLEDPAVVAALKAHQAALEAGELPDRRLLLEEFPDIASQLAECIDVLELVHRVAPQLGKPSEDDDSENTEGWAPVSIGDFRIEREIGRGGMGVVYRAQQVSLGRQVALKVLPYAAALEPNQLKRFQLESRAAAILEHPHIVAVYGIGCERAVHYYAMQLINGQSLADAIRELRTTNADRESKDDSPDSTVAFHGSTPHGEANASVHSFASSPFSSITSPRDREFFRIAATLAEQAVDALAYAHEQEIIHRDIKPANLLLDAERLWITDFGLARVGRGVDITLTGDLLGTIRYMSPEQVHARRGFVDHRTDIYSLGISLYELLTLAPVFAGNERNAILHRICFEEPPAPRQLNRAIPRDLESIVLKAIAKRPDDRYTHAAELAEDLRRFLSGQPISAKPLRFGARFLRLARRHAVAAAILTVASLIAAAASAVTTYVFIQKNRTAELRAEQAERDRDRALAVEERVPPLELAPIQSPAALSTGSSEDRSEVEVWKSALAFHRGAKAREADDYQPMEHAKLLVRLGKHLANTGAIREAVTHFREAVNVVQTMELLSNVDTEGQSLIAEALLLVARYSQAIGDLNGAEDSYEQAERYWKELAQRDPQRAFYQQGLGVALTGQAAVYALTRRYTQAEQAYQSALQVLNPLVDQYSRSSDRNSLAAVHSNMAQLTAAKGRPDDAEQHLRSALEMSRALTQEDPENRDYAFTYAATLNNLGRLYEHTGRTEDAIASYGESLTQWERLYERWPGDPQYRSEAAKGHSNLAGLYMQAKRFREAAAAYDEELSIRERLARQFAEQPQLQSQLASAYAKVADFYASNHPQKERRTAEQFYEAAIRIGRELADNYPRVTQHKYNLAIFHNNYGVLFATTGRRSQAVDQLNSAIGLREQLTQLQPGVPAYRIALGENYFNRGLFASDNESAEQALEWFERAARQFDNVLAGQPRHNEAIAGLKKLLLSRAERLEKLGRGEEAQNDRRRLEQLGGSWPD